MSKRKLILIISIAWFASFAFQVAEGTPFGFDSSAQEFFFSLRCGWLNAIAVPFSYTGGPQMVIALLALLLIIPQTRKPYAIPMAAAGIVNVIAHKAFKAILQRPRPDAALWLMKEHGYSFPSGHSCDAILVWGMFILLVSYYNSTNGASLPIYKNSPAPTNLYPKTAKNLGICKMLATAYIIFMGLSRIYVGVHWPSDVIGGFFLGLACLQVLSYFVFKEDPQKPKPRYQTKKISKKKLGK